MSSAWRQNSLDGELMGTMFFTTYTSVRTAILTPLAILLVFMVSAAEACDIIYPGMGHVIG
jgi:hypothetical protein